MIKVQPISDLDGIMRILTEQNFDSRVNRYRSGFLYRGLPNSSYHLETSLKRNCKDKKKVLEECILRNFTKYAAIDDPRLSESKWRQLIIGQHHGLPTRLVDWTYSPLMGLHFATSGEEIANMEKHDCILWKIDIEEFNSLLPGKYQEKLKEHQAYLFTVDMLSEVAESIKAYDVDMRDQSMVLLEPPSIDQRIINQYSYFSIIPENIDSIEGFLEERTKNTCKYVIAKELKWRVRDMLDQMNINERIVYPGLDGLSQWIRRHYYVK